jgi:hypothetical protein
MFKCVVVWLRVDYLMDLVREFGPHSAKQFQPNSAKPITILVIQQSNRKIDAENKKRNKSTRRQHIIWVNKTPQV